MVTKKQDICLLCSSDKELELLDVREVVEVRGELFDVMGKYLTCPDCGEQQYDPKSCISVQDAAYREYRKEHNMLQPEEIKELRESYDLTQREFASKLGIDEFTLSTYENGALHSKEVDKKFKTWIKKNNNG